MVTSQYEWVIQPSTGVGPLRFGMTKQEVYGILGPPVWRGGPDEFSDLTREQFSPHYCFVEFKPDGRCRSVAFDQGAPGVVIDGQELMVLTYRTLVAYLRSRGSAVVEEGDGFRCDDLGLAAYAPKLADPELSDAPVESLLVYERGYYDRVDEKLAKMKQ